MLGRLAVGTAALGWIAARLAVPLAERLPVTAEPVIQLARWDILGRRHERRERLPVLRILVLRLRQTPTQRRISAQLLQRVDVQRAVELEAVHDPRPQVVRAQLRLRQHVEDRFLARLAPARLPDARQCTRAGVGVRAFAPGAWAKADCAPPKKKSNPQRTRCARVIVPVLQTWYPSTDDGDGSLATKTHLSTGARPRHGREKQAPGGARRRKALGQGTTRSGCRRLHSVSDKNTHQV